MRAEGSGDIARATQEASEGVRELKENTEGAAEELHLKSLTRLRTLTHVIRGIAEIGEGGTAALGGLATEGYVLTEVFEGMLGPIGLIGAALTGLLAIGIPVFERMSGANKEVADAAKEAAAEAQKAWEDSITAQETAIKRVIFLQDQQLKAQQQINAELPATSKLIDSQIDQAEREAELKIKSKYAVDSQLTSDPEKLEALKRARDTALAGLKGDKSALTADEQASEKRQAAEDEAKRLHTLKEQQAELTAKAAHDAAAREQAEQRIAREYGATFDPKTGNFRRRLPDGITPAKVGAALGAALGGAPQDVSSENLEADLKAQIQAAGADLVSFSKGSDNRVNAIAKDAQTLGSKGLLEKYGDTIPQAIFKAVTRQEEAIAKLNDLLDAKAVIRTGIATAAAIPDKTIQAKDQEVSAQQAKADAAASEAAEAEKNAKLTEAETTQAKQDAARNDNDAAQAKRQEDFIAGREAELKAKGTKQEQDEFATNVKLFKEGAIDFRGLNIPGSFTPENPFADQLARLTKQAEELQKTIDQHQGGTEQDGLTREEAQRQLDALNGVSRINGQIVTPSDAVHNALPGTLPYAQAQFNSYVPPVAETGTQAKIQGIRDEGAATVVGDDAKLVAQIEAWGHTHASLVGKINDASDHIGTLIQIAEAMSKKIDAKTDANAAAIKRLEAQLKSAHSSITGP